MKSHPKSPKKRKETTKTNLLYDVAIMGIIHFIVFFIYVTVWSHHGHKQQQSSPTSSNSMKAIFQSSHPNIKVINNKNDIIDQPQHIIYEPGYPKISRTHYFPTHASEKEMAKHDRYIVHGMLYMEMLNEKYLFKHWKNTEVMQDQELQGGLKTGRKICMNILMKNRSQPYISALMMSLMKSHEEDEETDSKNAHYRAGDDLLSYVELNVFDTERRQDQLIHDRQRERVLSLPFLNVHKSTTSQTKQNYNDSAQRSGSRNNSDYKVLHQIEDYLKIAKHCIKSNLEYCLIMQEYTIVPIDFMDSIKNIITTIESEKLFDTTNSDTLSSASSASMISFFSAYDHELQSIIKIHDVNYSHELYQIHRGKLNSERKGLGLEPHQHQYQIRVESGIFDGGYNVAMLFHIDSVKEKLVPFLTSMRNEVMIMTTTTTSKKGQQKSRTAGNFDLEGEYIRYFEGSKKYVIEPSLVNRIGFYDEDYSDDFDNDVDNDVDVDDERLGITNWLTDSRFLFEAGKYWEGKEMFCQKPNGEWIEDEFYFDNGDKSSCKGDKK